MSAFTYCFQTCMTFLSSTKGDLKDIFLHVIGVNGWIVMFGWTTTIMCVLFVHKDTMLLCSSAFIHSLVMILLGWGLNGNRLSGMWRNHSVIPNCFRTNVDLDSLHEMLKLQTWEELHGHDAAYWLVKAHLGLKWKQCVLIFSYWPGVASLSILIGLLDWNSLHWPCQKGRKGITWRQLPN